MRGRVGELILGLLLILGSTALPILGARAQSPVFSFPPPLPALGYCQLSVGGTAVALTSCSGGIPTTASGMAIVSITVEGANIRYRDDGTAPTAAVGIPLLQGQNLPYSGSNYTALSFIAQSGTATVDIGFYAR